MNGQHPDYGTQYRSAIFYKNEEEKQLATAFKDSLQTSGLLEKPIATEISEHTKFWIAEDYHQDYERLNPNQGYIRAVSIPRLNAFKSKYPELIKE